MIISASRRTDIPNYYSEWFLNRLKEGFVYVRNPMNARQISKVDITPEAVDCVVFWTKNPAPMLNKLNRLKGYHYYFQFTVTSYEKDVEPAVPSKGYEIIDTFRRLSDKIGRERVIWRYDPILLNGKYNMNHHVEYFSKLAEKLRGYTEKCTISFLDVYRKNKSKLIALNINPINSEEKRALAAQLVKIAKSYDLRMDACAESIELNDLGIARAKCIDGELIEKIIGCKISAKKDKNQRSGCGCAASIDIGAYDCCPNGCGYCYANTSAKTAEKNFALHDASSPLLCGVPIAGDKIKERTIKSIKESQSILF